MRKRCEATVKAEVDELTFMIKRNELSTETEVISKVELLRQIITEMLEPVKFREKDAFVSLTCADLLVMGFKQLLQSQRLKQTTD